MAISHKGFHTDVITLNTEGVVRENAPVTVIDGDSCKTALLNEDFIGVVVNIRDDLASVQVAGYVETSYTGTAPSLGFTGLCGTNGNFVKASDTAVKYRVLKVDTVNRIVGFIL